MKKGCFRIDCCSLECQIGLHPNKCSRVTNCKKKALEKAKLIEM